MRLLLAAIVAASLAAPAVASPETAPPPEKKICKTIQPVGTLARAKKDCRTAKEWEDIARSAREAGQDYQGAGWAAGSEGTRPAQDNPMPNGSPF